MEFLVLGPLQVSDAGRPVTIGAPWERALPAVDDLIEIAQSRGTRAFTAAECDIYDIDPRPASV